MIRRVGRRGLLEGSLFFVLCCLPGVGWLLGALVAVGDDRHEREPGPTGGEAAPRGRRLAAGLVDAGVAYLLCLIPYLGWLGATFFLALRDHRVLGGRSPGKRLLGLRMVGTRSAADHVRRNLTLALPLIGIVLGAVEAWRLFRRKSRLGDRWAGTTVILA
jgi:hypothetical protein